MLSSGTAQLLLSRSLSNCDHYPVCEAQKMGPFTFPPGCWRHSEGSTSPQVTDKADGGTDRLIGKWMNGWVDGRTDGQTGCMD